MYRYTPARPACREGSDSPPPKGEGEGGDHGAELLDELLSRKRPRGGVEEAGEGEGEEEEREESSKLYIQYR